MEIHIRIFLVIFSYSIAIFAIGIVAESPQVPKAARTSIKSLVYAPIFYSALRSASEGWTRNAIRAGTMQAMVATKVPMRRRIKDWSNLKVG